MTDIDPRQEWATPSDFWAAVNDEFQFELDACATAENAKCENFISPEQDGLVTAWANRTWCNPGFGKPRPWMARAYYHAVPIESCQVVMGRIAPSTKWWKNWALRATEIRLLTPRPEFVEAPEVKAEREAKGKKKTGNMQECALFVFRWNPHRLPPQIWTWQWKEATGKDKP